MELGVQVTFGTSNETLGQKQLTPLVCSREGWGDIRVVISDHGGHEYKWKNKFPVSAGCGGCWAWLRETRAEFKPRLDLLIAHSLPALWKSKHVNAAWTFFYEVFVCV